MSYGPVAFLTARLDEGEAAAWSVHDVAKCDALLYEEDLPGAAARTPDCDCGYPARVLREVVADRKLLAKYQLAVNLLPGKYKLGYCEALEEVIKIRAARFSDHLDYRPEWKPQA